MYELYAERMCTNISRVTSTPTPSTDIEEDDTEILTLSQDINAYRYDANVICSSSNTLSF